MGGGEGGETIVGMKNELKNQIKQMIASFGAA